MPKQAYRRKQRTNLSHVLPPETPQERDEAYPHRTAHTSTVDHWRTTKQEREPNFQRSSSRSQTSMPLKPATRHAEKKTTRRGNSSTPHAPSTREEPYEAKTQSDRSSDARAESPLSEQRTVLKSISIALQALDIGRKPPDLNRGSSRKLHLRRRERHQREQR